MIFHFSPSEVNISHVHVSHQVSVLSPDSFADVVNAKDNQWQLFPQSYVTIGTAGLPFKLLPENNELMLKQIGHGVPILYTRDGPKSFPVVKSLSVPDAVQITNGLRYTISYYGYDIEDCVSHVYTHLKSADKLTSDGKYTVCLQFPIQLDYQAVQSILKEKIKITMKVILSCCILEHHFSQMQTLLPAHL